MTPAEKIGRMAKAKNEELEKQARTELTVGAVFAVLVFGGFFIGAYLLGLIGVASPLLFAFGLTVAMAGLGFLVAWRSVDPTRELLPLDDPPEIVKILSKGTPQALFFTPRFEIPGALSFLLSGPENIVSAYGIRNHSLPDDPELFERCVKLLKRCEDGYQLSRMKQPRAAVLLRQLALVRVEVRDTGATLVLNDAGRTFLDQI